MISVDHVRSLLAGSEADLEVAISIVHLARQLIGAHKQIDAYMDGMGPGEMGCHCDTCKKCQPIALLKIAPDEVITKKKNEGLVRDFIMLCDRVIALLDDLENDPSGEFPASFEALDFAKGTRPKVTGMRDYAIKNNRVTDKMWTAANNINRGAENWSREQHEPAMFSEDDYPIFHDF